MSCGNFGAKSRDRRGDHRDRVRCDRARTAARLRPLASSCRLDRIAPQANEDEALHTEKKLLQSSEQRRQAAEGAREALEDDAGAFAHR